VIRDGLAGRDLLHRQDDGLPRHGAPHSTRPVARVGDRAAQPCVRRPGPERGELCGIGASRHSFRSRLDARTRSVLAGAAVAAVLVNAGAIWAYWRITGADAGPATAGTVMALHLGGRSDLNEPLVPGGTGNLIVTVPNDNGFPIRITSISPGAGTVTADDEHRGKGCVNPGVVVVADAVAVQWDVARNIVAAFTVPHALAMADPADPACRDAVFTVPVLATALAGNG
jgi:hypothetical protein